LLFQASSAAVVMSSHGYNTMFSRMVWSLLAPLFSLLNYVRTLLFGGGASNAVVGGSSNVSRGRNMQQSSSSNPAPTQNPT